MQTQNKLTRSLTWKDMLRLWNKQYMDINPSPASEPLLAFIVTIVSTSIPACIVAVYRHFFPLSATGIFITLITLVILFASAIIIWYFVYRPKKIRRNLELTDRGFSDSPASRASYWICGYLSEKRLKSISSGLELQLCCELLTKAKFLPMHEEKPGAFMKYIQAIVEKTDQLMKGPGDKREEKWPLMYAVDEYMDFLRNNTEGEFEALGLRIKDLLHTK